MFDYMGDFYRSLYRLCPGGVDVAVYGRRQLSHPHRSDRRKRGGKAKARRLA